MRTEALKRIALGILCLAALAGCGSGGTGTNSPSAGKTFVSEELGFKLTFPESWTVSNATSVGGPPIEAHSVMLSGTARPAYMSVVVSDVNEGIMLNDAVERQVEMAKRMPNYEFVEKVQTNLAGASAYKVTYATDSAKGNVRLISENYTLISGKRGYRILVMAPKSDYDKYAKEIDAIVKSFKLIDAK